MVLARKEKRKTRIRWAPWRRMFWGCGMAMLAEKVGDNGDHRMKKVVPKSQREGAPLSTGPTQGS